MIGLDYVMAGYMHLASGGIDCKPKKSPQVIVETSDTAIRYDLSKDQRQLDNFQYDTVSPYDRNVDAHVGGLMAGEVNINQNIRVLQESYELLNRGCLYIDTVKVELKVKPVIYVAREYPRGSCMYNSVLNHEKKHVAIDQGIVLRYKKIIAEALNSAVRTMGAAQGPYRLSELPAEQRRIEQYTQGIVRRISDSMSAERKREQQKLDNLEEYERVQSACRGRRL